VKRELQKRVVVATMVQISQRPTGYEEFRLKQHLLYSRGRSPWRRYVAVKNQYHRNHGAGELRYMELSACPYFGMRIMRMIQMATVTRPCNR
jgi:hypothetical protein